MLFLYVEPGSAQARRLQQSMTDPTDTVLFAHVREPDLLGTVGQNRNLELAHLLAVIAPGDQEEPIDARIRLALDMVRELPQHTTASHLAAEVGLSTSRLLHLFSAEVGTSFRRYRLWARVLLVARALSRGSDLTTSAIDAGFASPSHFSDTFRKMFGLSATRLLAQPVQLVVDQAE